MRHGSSSPSSTGGGAGASAYSASSGIVRTGQPGPAPSSSSRLRSSHTMAAGRAICRRRPRSLARSCSVHGSTTAPIRKHATIESTHSGRLPMRVRTTSPRATPRAARAPASAPERRATSPKGHSRRPPSRSSATRARRPGSAASTRARAKFMRRRRLTALHGPARSSARCRRRALRDARRGKRPAPTTLGVMRMTRFALLISCIAALAVPAVASADADLLAPGTTGLTAPTGIARTSDGALWVADEVRGVCRVVGGQLVDSPYCGNAPHTEVETAEPVHTEALAAAAGAPVDAGGAPVAPASVSGLAFDPRTQSFYVGDRSSSGGGVWRLQYADGAIAQVTQIAAVADRVETVALGPDGSLYFATKRAGQILRIADPAGQPAAPELVATLGAAPDGTEFALEAMAATGDALYLGGIGLSRLSLTDADATPQPVVGFEGREIAALAADPTLGRLYVGDVAPQLGNVVEVVNVDSGDHETYEQGFATVTTLGVDAAGAVLVADDPSLQTNFTAWQARLWEIPTHATGWPQATIVSGPAAASAATDVS